MVEFVVKLSRTSCQNSSRLPIARTANDSRQSTVSVVQRCYDASVWSERCHIVAGSWIQLKEALLVTIAGFRLCTWLFRIGSAGNSGSSFSPGGHWRPLAATAGHWFCTKAYVANSSWRLRKRNCLSSKHWRWRHWAQLTGRSGRGLQPRRAKGSTAARDKHCFKIIKVSDRIDFYQLVLWNKNPTYHSKTLGVYFPMVFRVFSDQWRWGCRQRGEVGALEPAASAADGAGGWRWLPIHSDYPDSQNDICIVCMYIYIEFMDVN